MNPTSKLFFVLLLTLCAHQILGQTPSNDPITQACNPTLYQVLCKNTLEADPASKGANLTGLAKIALTAASIAANETFDVLNDLFGRYLDDYDLQLALSNCLDYYLDAIHKFTDLFPALESGRYNDVNVSASAAMTDGDSCEGGFSAGKSLIPNMSVTFNHLISNALAIVKQLIK